MKTTFRLPAQIASSVAVAAQKASSFAIGAMILLGAGMAQPAQAQTQATEPVQMTQPDAQSLRVRINNPAQQKASMQVIDLNTNQTLLNETYRTPAYGTRLQFNGLPAGRYAVLCRVGANRYRYTVDVAAPQAGATSIAVRETTTRRVETGLATAAL
ncbi:hypothetical protein [Hymenobacter properus]|uniref:EfeO-type cupredoxin-like domain-containing protein n=1 Tax=Hymenobacter properus TaxID=2791026 RepID=A0A931BDZ8_9BACT|nr:hypothetical protein [Hymenobacter properus]MBF9142074.1 hypothetical protein [Hymenobacter properus]MBR7720881.1 hypothetical protein [Microvirga sp. SRT04]